MKITHPYLMKITSLITVFMLTLAIYTPVFVAFAEEGGDSSAQSSGGDGGTGGGGGSGDGGGTGATGGDGGGSSSTSDAGDSSSSGGDGGTGGTGGDSTGGAGTGGDGATGGEGGTSDSTAEGGEADATGGDGGTGGTGGDATGNGTAGDGGAGATGGDAGATSETDDQSDAGADATGGTGGSGGDGGTGTGANSDGGTGGEGGTGGAVEGESEATGSGEAETDATGGDGGSGGTGGDGGNADGTVPDGNPTIISTGDASSSSTGGGSSNTTDATLPLGTEEDEETELEIENVLGATTTATSTAETGENTIVDADTGIIETGMASAFSWIFALFNVAIVNSTGAIHFFKNPVGEELNFTQRFVDAFRALAHDGVCSLISCDGIDGVVLEVYDENVAEVENVAISRSQSGTNDCESSDGTCVISTGDTDAMSGIVNVGNLTMVDSRYLLLFMANQGDLDGDILLPDGAFFDTLSTGARIGARSDITASSTAEIIDVASSTAETGANTAIGTDESTIDTGDAHATAKDVNFVNHLGAPICFIVSVGGEWRGDIVQLPNRFHHEPAAFGHVICGAGGAERDPVTGLELEVVNYAKILNTAIAEAVSGNNEAEGLIARIKTGDANAFAQILNLVNITMIGQDWIFADFAISGDWDGDLVFGVKPGEDDVLGELIEQHVLGGDGGGSSVYWNHSEPEMTITKTASVEQAMSPASVEYTIVVTNNGGDANDVAVIDTMKGPDGSVIGKQMWKLDDVKQNEEVKITYTIEFEGDVAAGYYTNDAVLTGRRSSGSSFGKFTASDVVEVGVSEVAAKSCTPLLTEYIRPWRMNDKDQVRSLQSFLNAYEGEDLQVSGIYSPATQAAVKRFQSKHAADVLAPWGISQPTANVYYTTQKKVNSMVCADLDFSLSDAQNAEIEAFKSKSKNEQESVVKQGNTGLVPPSLLQMPSFAAPQFFKTDASHDLPASTSALLRQQLKGFASWILFAPFVEAFEI